MVPEWMAIFIAVFMYANGFLLAWAISHDGKSKFWTAFMDIFSLRIIWRQ